MYTNTPTAVHPVITHNPFSAECVPVCMHANDFFFVIPLSMRLHLLCDSLSLSVPLPVVNYTEPGGLSSLICKDTTPAPADPLTLLLKPPLHTHTNTHIYSVLIWKHTRGGLVCLIVYISWHKMRGRRSNSVKTQLLFWLPAPVDTSYYCT